MSIAAALLAAVCAPAPAQAASRLWLYTAAVSDASSRMQQQQIDTVRELAGLVRGKKQLQLADERQQADVLVDVRTANEVTYASGEPEHVVMVQLTVDAGRRETTISAAASSSKKAIAHAYEQLVRWLERR